MRWNEAKQRWMAVGSLPRRDRAARSSGGARPTPSRTSGSCSPSAPKPPRSREVAEHHHQQRATSSTTCGPGSESSGSTARPQRGSRRCSPTWPRLGYATSTVDRAWLYLNQACQFGLRQRLIKNNPAAEVLLPEARPGQGPQVVDDRAGTAAVGEAIPRDGQPAMWLTAGLMCGLRPGELAGLRWPFVDVDSDDPVIDVAEHALEINDRYAGQAASKTAPRPAAYRATSASCRRAATTSVRAGAARAVRAPRVSCSAPETGRRSRCRTSASAFQNLCERAGLGQRLDHVRAEAFLRVARGRPTRRPRQGCRPRGPRRHPDHAGLPPSRPTVSSRRHRGVGPPPRLGVPGLRPAA